MIAVNRKGTAAVHAGLGYRRLCIGLLAAGLLLLCAHASVAQANFGLSEFKSYSSNSSDPNNPFIGNPNDLSTQAGGHPYENTTMFTFNSHPSPLVEGVILPDADVRTTIGETPAGFIGDPEAAPACSLTVFTDATQECPVSSQVGISSIYLGGLQQTNNPSPIYNITPEAGKAAEFGFTANGFRTIVYASVRTDGDYGISIGNEGNLQARITHVALTFWGVPSDPSHDLYRGIYQGKDAPFGTNCGYLATQNQPLEIPCTNSSGAAPRPFLSNPTDCTGGPITAKFLMDSWQDIGNYQTYTATSPAPTGCGLLGFNPTLTASPSSDSTESPTGLEVVVDVPQTTSVSQLATPPLKDASVALPVGVTVSSASADGLVSCSDAQLDLHSKAPAACPEASKFATVTVHTFLQNHPLPGAIYLGAPECGPCSGADALSGRLVRLFLVVNDPRSGVVIKVPGTTSIDPSTGQLTTKFDNNPQLPFNDLDINFLSGPRAPLATPQSCGHYTVTSDFTPWSSGGPEGTPDATPSAGFDITSGPNGTPCPTRPEDRAVKPTMSAGTINPIAGIHSPLVVNLHREDGEQQFSRLDFTTPPGLLATLKGVPYCSGAALAAAEGNGGRAETLNSSCPTASQIGSVTVGAGPGNHPFFTTGKVFLTGPYKGAPLGLAIVTPAVAGPFDLGTVVVRSQIQVDQTDAHVHVVSDQIPQMLDGIPLDIRDIRVNLDRPDFTINPTNCSPFNLFADVFGSDGGVGQATNPFQVGACAALPFSPTVSLTLKGATKRAQNPALRAVVTEGVAGEANAAFASVALPKSEFLDNNHIGDVCTRVQFSAGTCPATSIYGHAKAWSPLLEAPLEGPVYLRSSDHLLPDLVAALKGPASQPLEVDLAGRVDSGASGGIRTTFDSVPDAEVSKFVLEMQGGKKGLLENSTDLCAHTHRAVARLTAQNGKAVDERPIVAATSCDKGKKSRLRRGK
jgi:hypothetical protein